MWGQFETGTLEVTDARSTSRIHADIIIIATGAYDRPVPLPGWTLPGVLTVGGAQTLLKAQRIIPGRRILLVGTGPLLLVVASQLAKAGAHIAAIVDTVPATALLPHLVSLCRAWPLFKDGIGYRATLARAGVRWLSPYVLTRIDGSRQVEGAIIARADEEWRPIPGTERTFEVDTVCVGYGLVPSVELLRLAGCQLRYDEPGDVWIPERRPDGETSVPGVFAVGDGAGVAGVRAALEEGRIAGVSAAHRLGKLSAGDADRRMEGPRIALARLRSFRAVMDAVYRPRRGLRELATPDTVVCRCEEVTRGEIESAIADGAGSPAQVKAWTRAGMGACQARMCALPTMQLVASRLGRAVAEVGTYTSRPPLKPVAVSSLVREMEGIDAGAIAGQGVTHPDVPRTERRTANRRARGRSRAGDAQILRRDSRTCESISMLRPPTAADESHAVSYEPVTSTMCPNTGGPRIDPPTAIVLPNPAALAAPPRPPSSDSSVR